MKKIITFILLIVMSMSLSVMAFAEDSTEEDKSEPNRSSYASATISDNDNNQYLVSGSVSYSGKKGSVSTYFKNTYVHDGSSATQQLIYNGTKTLGAHGTVWLSGGGYNDSSLGSISHTVSYTLETTYNPTETFLYNITYIVGSHVFSYNGAYWTASTSFPY
ncbi:MAG: hypothetical protein IJH99_08780 [Eubacterium sp.]|nr:hypothetical protein [Eubacterium sp.]